MPDTRPGLDALRRKAIDDLYAVFAPDVVLEAEVEAILARIVEIDCASPATGDSRPEHAPQCMGFDSASGPCAVTGWGDSRQTEGLRVGCWYSMGGDRNWCREHDAPWLDDDRYCAAAAPKEEPHE